MGTVFYRQLDEIETVSTALRLLLLMSVMMRHWGSVRFTAPSLELPSDSRP